MLILAGIYSNLADGGKHIYILSGIKFGRCEYDIAYINAFFIKKLYFFST